MGIPASQRRMQQLVEDHYASLYRFAFRLTGTAADAEDLTQEAFCTAQRKMSQVRDTGRIKSWLYTILRNAYLHRVRADKTHRLVSLDGMSEPAEPPDEVPCRIDPELLQNALSELPEVYRTPLLLFYFEEFSYRDIAEQMDLPIGTVMSRLARAKEFLRCRLGTGVADLAAPNRKGASHGL